jgi:hypothetical protein
MNAGGAGRYGGQDDFGRRDRKIRPVMFANADEGKSELVGELALLDDITDSLCLREWLAVGINGGIAKGVESQFDGLWHG